MHFFALVLCFLVMTAKFLIVLGLEEGMTQEKMIGNQLEEFKMGRGMQMKYGEYPLVVTKRAALLLDRLMVALHKALEGEEGPGMPPLGSPAIRSVATRNTNAPLLPLPRVNARDVAEAAHYLRMDPNNFGLQRRGHNNENTSSPKGRVWRCYFNAVTCFKKK